MKNWLYPGVFAFSVVLFETPAQAKGLGIIGDLWSLGQNVFNGTIPLPYVIGFSALIVTIVILGVFEARKNARKAEQEEQQKPIDLTK